MYLIRYFSPVAAILLAGTASAGVRAPYSADANTVHLFQFETDAGATIAPNLGTAGRNAVAVSTSGAASTGTGAPVVQTAILGVLAKNVGAFGFGRPARITTSTHLIGYDAGGTAGVYEGETAAERISLSSLGIGAQGAFTLEALVRPGSASGLREIICTDNTETVAANRGFQFRIATGGTTGQRLEFNLIGQTGTQVFGEIPNSGDHAWALNQWFHVAFAYDGTSYQFYWTRLTAAPSVANRVSGPSPATISTGTITGPLVFGNENRGVGGEFLNGYLDQVRISNVSRADSDFVFNSDPADADGDGLLDAWEIHYFGSTAAQSGSGDPDGDGVLNDDEEAANSDPTPSEDFNGDGLVDHHFLTTFDALGSSSLIDGLNWQDSLVPVAGRNYFVSVTSLRSPIGAAAYSFPGANLTVYKGGTLLVKGSGLLTFPSLVLDGGKLHNGTDLNVVVTVEGALNVFRDSEIVLQNSGFVLNSALTGTGKLTLSGANAVTFAGPSSWTGSLQVGNTAGFTLASTGTLAFAPGVAGLSNAITGTGPATLNGTFTINVTAASQANGASWVLVSTSGTKTYGESFNVSGFTSDGGVAGARKWTSGVYQFDEATGTLSVVQSISALEAWRVLYFGASANSGVAADDVDADGDGRANLVEYAQGTDPEVADSGPPVTVSSSAGQLTLTFAHSTDASLIYTVEASNDLVTWTPVEDYSGFTTAGTTIYTDNVTVAPGARRFLRLRISY